MTESIFPPFEQFEVINGLGPKAFHLGKKPHELVFVAAQHSSDPNSPLYDIIRDQFDHFKPEVVLHESYWRDQLVGDPIELIKRFGEPAYAISLAKAGGIPAETIEIGREAEYTAYIKKYGEELVTTFILLRQIWQYHRTQVKEPTFEADVRAKFEQGFRELGIGFNWEELDSICRRVLDKPFTPDDPASLDYYRSITDPTKTGTVFNEISLYTSFIRDEAVVKKIARLKQKHQRILAVMGSSHYYTIESYLKQLYSS